MPAAPQETVVRRAVVAVLTRGTLSDPAMLQSQPDPAWLLALAEAPAADGAAQRGADDRVQIGACFLDAASGQLLMGEWCAAAPLAPARTRAACFGCRPPEQSAHDRNGGTLAHPARARCAGRATRCARACARGWRRCARWSWCCRPAR
jgi:hypothetical protein